jgi:acetylornithine deacetylase/succinyl-diaminopimelate desuccinylase-like protein
MGIIWTQASVVQAKIACFGKVGSARGADRAVSAMERVSAIAKMTNEIAAIERWGAQFEKYIYRLSTDCLLPKVNIGAIESGAPCRPNYFSGVCSIYLDIRMPPQVRPIFVQKEWERAPKPPGFNCDLELHKLFLGHESKNVEPLVDSAEENLRFVFGKKIKSESSDHTKVWTDTNIYNEMGNLAIKIGPRGWHIGPRNEEVDIDVLVKAAQLGPLAALDICSCERRRTRP